MWEENGTRYSEKVQLSEQANLSGFTTIKDIKHTSFDLDPNYCGALGVNVFPLLQHFQKFHIWLCQKIQEFLERPLPPWKEPLLPLPR